MTIRRGEAWGRPGALPADGVVVRSDAEAHDIVTAARRTGAAIPTLGLLGGDVCRALGGSGDEGRLRSEDAVTFSMDLGEALLDGRLHYFLAHLVARRRLWIGRVVVVMNTPWLGEWNLGPKAHPNDGLLDASDARLRPGELLPARSRVHLGTHVPHPRIATLRAPAMQFGLDRPTTVRLDGRPVGSFRDLSVRVEPDALTVVV